MTTTTPITTTATEPSSHSPTTTTVSLDVTDLIRILQVQIPQLHNESIEHKVQMEDTREQYRVLCKETDSLRKKLLAVVQDNNKYRKIQERMESQIYAQQQELALVQKESQTLTRQRKHLEERLENELQNYESDRLLWQQRESDLSKELKRWSTQDRVSTPRRTRSATASNIFARSNNNNNSLSELQPWTARNTTNGGMCTLFEERTKSIDNVTARDTKIRVQEKLLSDLKSEIKQQKRVIHEAMLGAEVQDQRIDTLEQELLSLKEVNASLMEDNESYQILLHEKTMAGEFSKKSGSTIANEDEEETDQTTTMFTSDNNDIIMSNRFSSNNNMRMKKLKSTSLAAELNKVQIGDDCNCQHAASVQKLSDEIHILQESNKALSLYMNKILLKIVDNQELVDVLNIDENDENNGETTTPFTSSMFSNNHTIQQSLDSTIPTSSNNNNNNRPRRSTISSWISAPKQSVISESPTIVGRHRSHTNNDGNNNGSWSRALKRMTVIGWSSSKDSSNMNNNNDKSKNNDKNNKNNNNSNIITQANHDSAISSCESIILEE